MEAVDARAVKSTCEVVTGSVIVTRSFFSALVNVLAEETVSLEAVIAGTVIAASKIVAVRIVIAVIESADHSKHVFFSALVDVGAVESVAFKAKWTRAVVAASEVSTDSELVALVSSFNTFIDVFAASVGDSLSQESRIKAVASEAFFAGAVVSTFKIFAANVGGATFVDFQGTLINVLASDSVTIVAFVAVTFVSSKSISTGSIDAAVVRWNLSINRESLWVVDHADRCPLT